MRTAEQVCASLPRPEGRPLPTPAYSWRLGTRVAFAVQSMATHMTDEGWQLMLALEEAGYWMVTEGSDAVVVCKEADPAVAVVQDKREWEGLTADRSRDPRLRFRNVEHLADRIDRFRVTVLKDAHQDTGYNRDAALEIGCHAWIVYYHPAIVSYLAPFVRPQHIIRTYHTVDRTLVPPFASHPRRTCLLSGAIGRAYPLRTQLVRERGPYPDVEYLRHPGYHRKGCATPSYLRTLSQFKVAVCTSSIYGYALRKIVEATACGCRVVTDLPVDDPLPYIDGNLVRIDCTTSTEDAVKLVRQLARTYDPCLQQHYAAEAKFHYDYRTEGRRLVEEIERMRRNYT